MWNPLLKYKAHLKILMMLVESKFREMDTFLLDQLNSINMYWAWNMAWKILNFEKHHSHCCKVFMIWNMMFQLLWWIFWWLCRSLVTLNKCQWESAGMCQKPKCNQNSVSSVASPNCLKTCSIDWHSNFLAILQKNSL